MASPEDQNGAPAPPGEGASSAADPPRQDEPAGDTHVSHAPVTDVSIAYDAPHTYADPGARVGTVSPSTAVVNVNPASGGSGGSPPPPQPPDSTGGGDEEDGMLRMSFLDHLEELRSRLIRMVIGVGVAFIGSLTFSNKLWLFVQAPAEGALRSLGVNPPRLIAIDPMDGFNIVWVKLPILAAIFISSPWILYQIWGFIAPGLYKKERRWAAPFVICTAGLFITGGCFAYFVAFRYGLTFLLGIGQNINITSTPSITHYFDLFVNVMLGVSLIFELPVIIFFLTLLHIASPRFLISHSRYAILGIVVLAAIVTPTPDVFNMMLFAVPMCALFYLGIFASYLLVLHRENRKFPWRQVGMWTLVVLLLIAGALYLATARFGYNLLWHWPFISR